MIMKNINISVGKKAAGLAISTICMIIAVSAHAGVPYTSVVTGMAFLSKNMASDFYSMSLDNDKDAQMMLMATCTVQKTCLIIEQGTQIFLEEQAEYPLVKIRLREAPQNIGLSKT
jgi:UDP-N-acetylglucosamine 2-epimerase